ncbi:MAG: lantibiotic ABC transporter [Verrucomicrobiales bacterium]|nr:lantibiotic ABC transporter [Verrucomicrobiales bacterium]
MQVEGFESYEGVHCETVAAGALLQHRGIKLSEPMLFGIGEGLGYIFWRIPGMKFPFIGGRNRPDALLGSICRNLGIKLESTQTKSVKKAWQTVVNYLEKGIPVGLKLNSEHLGYLDTPLHLGCHYVAMYGCDESDAYLIDAVPGGRVTVSLENLARARAARGSMSSNHRTVVLEAACGGHALDKSVRAAIKANAEFHLHPPDRSIGVEGIRKTAYELKRWFGRSEDVARDFCGLAKIMEEGGTGGAFFRNLYRDFLKESFEALGHPALERAHQFFIEIAEKWSRVSSLLDTGGATGESRHVDEACAILKMIAAQEEAAMKGLQDL